MKIPEHNPAQTISFDRSSEKKLTPMRSQLSEKSASFCSDGYRSISSDFVSLKKIRREATIVIVRIVDSAAAVP